MVKNPDITIVLTKMPWCSHCNDFLEIYNNINSRIKHNKLLKNKKVITEEYNMEQEEAKFAEKYKDYMSKIDGYPTLFIFVRNDNKIHGETIDHTVIKQPQSQPSKKNMKKLIDDATDMFISKMESKYKSVIDEKKDEYVNVESGAKEGTKEGAMSGGGVVKCGGVKCGGGGGGGGGGEDYEHKYRKYKTKYLNLLSNI